MHDKSQADVTIRGFWNWGTSALFDMQNFNLDAVSYLLQMSVKYLETADKEKKDKYPQPCLERRHTFTPMLYSSNRIVGKYAVATPQHLTLILSNNLKREYLEMCGFIRYMMSLAVVRSNNFILRGARGKQAHIFQRPDLGDGAVMVLIAPWRV